MGARCRWEGCDEEPKKGVLKRSSNWTEMSGEGLEEESRCRQEGLEEEVKGDRGVGGRVSKM